MEVPELSLENLDEMEGRLRMHAEGALVQKLPEEIHMYVCTHGARDCRCGTIGGDVFRALRREVTRRAELDPSGVVGRVVVGEVGHVGGHQLSYAFLHDLFRSDSELGMLQTCCCSLMANGTIALLILFRCSRWYYRLGRLKPPDVPGVLSGILNTKSQPFSPSAPPLFPQHWRGRMGLSKEDQVELFVSHQSSPPPVSQARV